MTLSQTYQRETRRRARSAGQIRLPTAKSSGRARASQPINRRPHAHAHAETRPQGAKNRVAGLPIRPSPTKMAARSPALPVPARRIPARACLESGLFACPARSLTPAVRVLFIVGVYIVITARRLPCAVMCSVRVSVCPCNVPATCAAGRRAGARWRAMSRRSVHAAGTAAAPPAAACWPSAWRPRCLWHCLWRQPRRV